jgi:hypothetical protein
LVCFFPLRGEVMFCQGKIFGVGAGTVAESFMFQSWRER